MKWVCEVCQIDIYPWNSSDSVVLSGLFYHDLCQECEKKICFACLRVRENPSLAMCRACLLVDRYSGMTHTALEDHLPSELTFVIAEYVTSPPPQLNQITYVPSVLPVVSPGRWWSDIEWDSLRINGVRLPSSGLKSFHYWSISIKHISSLFNI